MSEYQYYEFQAVDRPLSKEEMAELRRLSTRATITPTRLQNVYHYGGFRGNPLTLMERYFDAFVYVANWGSHQLMFRLPSGALDPKAARRYAVEGLLEVHVQKECVILDFSSEDEGGGGWVDDAESEGWMPTLLSVRADLLAGDLRALYLAWLAGAQAGMLDDEADDEAPDDEAIYDEEDGEDEVVAAATEPPVPPGLGSLSASLKALADFLRVDEDLLAVAAARSPAMTAGPSPSDLARWIGDLPGTEKDALLVRLVSDDGAPVRAELLRRFRQEHAPRSAVAAGSRTVAELLVAARERAEARKRREAERRAAERARKEHERAAAREAHLASLVGQEERLWRQVEALIEAKRPKEYDQAVELLKDVRDLAAHQEQGDGFARRLGPLRERYANRPALQERLKRAGLGA